MMHGYRPHVDEIKLRTEKSLRYVSRSKQLGAAAIDAYVRETVAALRSEFAATGNPFTQYHGCSKADEQIVEVCLPTDTGDRELPDPGAPVHCRSRTRMRLSRHPHGVRRTRRSCEGEGPHARRPAARDLLVDPWSRTPQMDVAFPLL